MSEYIKLSIKEIVKLAQQHNIDTTQPVSNVLRDITRYSYSNANMTSGDAMLNIISNQPVFERMAPGIMYNLCRLSKSWRSKCDSLDDQMWIHYYVENKKRSAPKWIIERYDQLPKWFADKFIYFPDYYKDKSLNFIKNYYFTSDIQIAPGYNVVAGIRSDGTVHSWGDDKFEVYDEVDNKNFIQIANSEIYTACLKSDGVVYFFNSLYDDIEPMYDIVQIACGFNHTVGLKRDGSVTTYSIPTPLVNRDFIQVACGENHAVGLRSDGTVTTWCDDNDTRQKQNEPGSEGGPPNKDFIFVTCGDFQSAGLRKDGSIVSWGTPSVPTPVNNKDFIHVACGHEHIVGLRRDGTVVTLGGVDMSVKRDEPGSNTGVSNSDFIQIACGSYHSVGLKSDGTVAMWGNITFGQRRNQPGSVNGVPNKDFIQIACKGNITTGLKIDGTCVTWGRIENVSPENLLV